MDVIQISKHETSKKESTKHRRPTKHILIINFIINEYYQLFRLAREKSTPMRACIIKFIKLTSTNSL